MGQHSGYSDPKTIKIWMLTINRSSLIGRREQEQGSYTRQKSRLIIAKSFSFREWQGSVDCLTSVDEVIPD